MPVIRVRQTFQLRSQAAERDGRHRARARDLGGTDGIRGAGSRMNRQMGDEVARAAQQLLDELGPEDKVTFWKYSDQVQKLADANQSRDAVKTELITMGTPAVSETNLYDAILATVAEMRPVRGRKAALSENLDKRAFYAAFWKATNSVFVTAKRCAFSSR